MPVTIKGIARQLHLNPSTVSRALSGNPQVSEDTREKVIKAARKLNYHPNYWAQNLVGAVSNLIGCLTLDLSNPFYIPMVRAVEDVAEQKKYMVFLSESRRQIEVEKAILERFRRIRIAGLIITPVHGNTDHLYCLENDGVPVVIAGRNLAGFDSINIDNIQSGFLAGQYLIQNGHRKIGYIYSGDPANIPEQQRLQGLIQALHETSLETKTIYKSLTNNIAGGERAAEMWFNDFDRPTAVFCYNDLLAMGFIQQVIKMGARVPQDVSVIGHDDIMFADTFFVPITTIVFPKYELGQLAMTLLIERINQLGKKHDPQTIALKPSIIVRNSCIGI